MKSIRIFGQQRERERESFFFAIHSLNDNNTNNKKNQLLLLFQASKWCSLGRGKKENWEYFLPFFAKFKLKRV